MFYLISRKNISSRCLDALIGPDIFMLADHSQPSDLSLIKSHASFCWLVYVSDLHVLNHFFPALSQRPHIALNHPVICGLICVQRPKVRKAPNAVAAQHHGSKAKRAGRLIFLSLLWMEGPLIPLPTAKQFFFSFFFFSLGFFSPSTFLSGCQLRGSPFYFPPAPKNKVQSSESLCADLGHLETLPLFASHR